ncbi:spartin a isoform X2 [Esox lucius]|uniref:spartin a isoform X2 n=1 Tax=Esox lucius TaxID=8010 RepID=UPI001476AF4B|nr:spartin a isoform X2 [Esox lucius]
MSLAEPEELILIRDQYERALECLTRGLAADQAGQRTQALELYSQGRQHLTHGLGVPTLGPRHQGAHWDMARYLQQKMRTTLTNISTRISNMEAAGVTRERRGEPVLGDLVDVSAQCLYPTLGAGVLAVPEPGTSSPSGDQPPAYTPEPTNGHHSLAHCQADRGGLRGQEEGGVGGGEELLVLPQGVQMFFVTSGGEVSAPSFPGYLRIIRFGGQLQNMTKERASAFLHVCDWLYPLTPDTPVLLSSSGIFMFPDVMAETPGSYVGVVLSSELPAADRHAFQDLLAQLTELRVQDPEEEGAEVMNLCEKVPIGPPVDGAGPGTREEKPPLPEWSEKMSQSILAGATWLSKGFVLGAEATGKAIQKGASKMREHITPENVPTEVKPSVTKGLQHAKQATGGAVRVSQFLVDGVCTVAGCVGEKLAPHIKKHGSKLIPESLKNSKDGRSNLEGARVVAASSLKGLSTMWAGLETGAKNIGKSVASETVTTVKHKFRGLEGILDNPRN